ncbi:Uma2 family endonuclease [Archangium violaceum]|nr:Uma2 family endonuclease [Archangium violaceum]
MDSTSSSAPWTLLEEARPAAHAPGMGGRKRRATYEALEAVPPHVLVPDIAGWRRERMPRTPRTAALTLAPDWVCEVLSPSTRTLDRTAKLPVYAREGVRFVWLVDPDARMLEVFRLEGSHYLLLATHAEQARLRAEPFGALEWELALLWAE